MTGCGWVCPGVRRVTTILTTVAIPRFAHFSEWWGHVRLTVEEVTYIQTQGLYVTEKCDDCKTILNQSVTYTIAGKPEVYCSSTCRDGAFFEDHLERKKRANPGRCVNCKGPLQGKRRGALYCDDLCRKRYAQKNGGISTAGAELSRKPNQLNQEVADTKIGGLTDTLRNRNRRLVGPANAKPELHKDIVTGELPGNTHTGAPSISTVSQPVTGR